MRQKALQKMVQLIQPLIQTLVILRTRRLLIQTLVILRTRRLRIQTLVILRRRRLLIQTLVILRTRRLLIHQLIQQPRLQRKRVRMIHHAQSRAMDCLQFIF